MLRERQCRKRKIAGDENDPVSCLYIEEPNTSELLGVVFVGVESLKDDGLIALHTHCIYLVS